ALGALSPDPGPARGLLRWHYKRRFSKTASPEYIVAFVRDVSMDWQLTSDARLTQLLAPGLTNQDDPYLQASLSRLAKVGNANLAQTIQNVIRETSGDMFQEAGMIHDVFSLAAADLGAEAQGSAESDLLVSRVFAQGFVAPFGVSIRPAFFLARD